MSTTLKSFLMALLLLPTNIFSSHAESVNDAAPKPALTAPSATPDSEYPVSSAIDLKY